MSPKYLVNYLILILFVLTSPTLLYADIATDGTVGAAQTLAGPDYAIPETLGTVKGNNLFHSFEKFSIKTKESATFTGSDSIKNVISRVTGGEKSDIDGTLRSNVGNADFYFINPSGVVFGQNAKVDVPAAFHVSTTDELKFADGSSFKASKSEQSTLTQAAPESFGFLGTQSASIEVNGSTLEFKPESKVSLTSSKDITIKGTETKQASLTSYGGEIELTAKGDLLMENAGVDTSGNGGGKITVKAGNVKLHNKSKIAADNRGDKNVDGNGVEIKADKEIEIKQGSRIQSNVFESGDSGTVKVEAQDMLIKQQEGEEFTGVFIDVEPDAKGNGKSIDVNVKEKLTIQGCAGIPSTTYGYGNSASVNVAAGELLIDGEGRATPYRNSEGWIAGISSETNKISNGNANNVSIYVEHLFTMLNGCVISGSIGGKGHAGNVIVKAENIKIDGQGSKKFTGIAIDAYTNSEGNAGKVEISAAEYFELINGGEISSTTFAKGNAGNVKINADNMKIDGQGSGNVTGIASDAYSEGNAGTVEITVAEYLELLNGGEISSTTFAKGNSGGVSINAGNIKIDGQGNYAGIYALAGSDGNAGQIILKVKGLFDLLNGGAISSSTFAKGDAGSIIINADNVKIDRQGNSSQFTGVASDAETNSEGNAGTVEITVAEYLEVLNGSEISSITFAKGDAGSVKINADNMKIDDQGSSKFTGVASDAETNSEGNAGTVEITVSEYLELLNGGSIGSDTFSKGDAGNVKINAGNMKIDGQSSSKFTGISSSANKDSEGNAGTVEITVVELLDLINGGAIRSSTFAKGNAGNVKINADNMKIDGQGSNDFTGVVSSSVYPNSSGKCGTIEITVAELLEVLNGGQISSSTFSKSDAGNVKINVKNMKIDRQGSSNNTEVSSSAEPNSEGNAGTVEITIAELLEVLNGGVISSSTWSKGDAGNVKINAKNMKIDDQGSIKFTGVASSAEKNSSDNAGTVEITVSEYLEVLNGGQISSVTWSKGNAGNVKINAKNMKIDGQCSSKVTGIASSAYYENSEGNAGTVEITVAEYLELLNGSVISSSTRSKGNAGNVKINAKNMKIDRQGSNDFPGVASSAEKNSSGNAGTVEITVSEYLEVLNGGQISSVTWSKGNAGDIFVNADKLIADASYISSDAAYTASGYVGNVSINANSVNLINGSEISIGAYQTLSPEKLANMPKDKSLTLNTKQLNIESGSQITSESTEHVPASHIKINSDVIYLKDGLITTSVFGTNGDGGNISINENADSNSDGFLVMQNGFIQANTKAEGSKGGKIRINKDILLIADKSMPFQIGGEPEAFSLDDKKNIIQAADPSKNPQDIEAPTVPVDLGSSLISSGNTIFEPVTMAENYCRLIGTNRASSLTLEPREWFVPAASASSSIYFDGYRLDELLKF